MHSVNVEKYAVTLTCYGTIILQKKTYFHVNFLKWLENRKFFKNKILHFHIV